VTDRSGDHHREGEREQQAGDEQASPANVMRFYGRDGCATGIRPHRRRTV
jgi:hypothetical protein